MAPKQPVAGPSKSSVAQSPSPSSSISAFNPSHTQFALALPVLGSADKLSIWDVASDRVIAEYEVEGASRATTVCWACGSSTASGQKKKRRRKSDPSSDGEEVVLLTPEKGGLVVFSPAKGEVIRHLDLPGKVVAAWSDDRGTILATPSSLLVFNTDASSIAHTFSLPSNTPTPTVIAILASSTSQILHILVASQSVTTLHCHLANSKITYSSPPLPVSTTFVTSLHPLPSTSQGTSFLVLSEDDRTVSQYTIPAPEQIAKLSYRYASPTLSPAHSVSTSSSLLSILHASGEISLFMLPTELELARPKSDSKPSTVKLVEGKDARLARLARAEFAFTEEGSAGALLCGRMAGAGRVKWHRVAYELPEGGVRPETRVKCDVQDLVGESGSNTIPLQRFAAPPKVAEVPQADDADEPASALPTDVDMADLSLGERLLALPHANGIPNGDSVPLSKPATAIEGPVNAASLTRLMIQALHTSDPALLMVCLDHRNPVLIRNTIRKMPAQLALPLLKACVERLGQGKGANSRGGGRGVGQNEQQGRGTVEWVKGVLVERGALLMTMPSLPLHLAQLSQLLQTRLQLYQPLLSLSGRLDLALAQIQMRRIAAEQALANADTRNGKRTEGERYIEGESEDEEDVPVEIDVDDGGEVEDVDMRGYDGDDVSEDDDEEDEDEDGENDEDEDEDDDEDDVDGEDEEDPLESGSGSENGFLDLEAEESGDDATASEEDE